MPAAAWRTEECGRIVEYNNPLVKDRWALRTTALSNRAEVTKRSFFAIHI
jgi:hypothetical protein